MGDIIKKLNEQFAQTASGDGFNSSNGVFKVTYKPYADLSMPKGRDPDPIEIKGQQYKIGQTVSGELINSTKNIIGKIISNQKIGNGTEIEIRIRSLKTNRIYKVKPASVQYEADKFRPMGNLGGASSVTAQERMMGNLKYGQKGNINWGSGSESLVVDGDPINEAYENKQYFSTLNPNYRINILFSNDPEYSKHSQNFSKYGHAYKNKGEKEIYVNGEDLKTLGLTEDHLTAMEAHEISHDYLKPELYKTNEDEEMLTDLLAITVLFERKRKIPYKILVSNFHRRHGKPYGVAKDLHVNSLLPLMF